MLPAPRRTAQRLAPAWPGRPSVPGFPHFSFDSSKLALHPHDGEQQPDGPHASSRLCDEDDSIAQGGPFAFLFNEHDEIDQRFDLLIK